MEQALDVEKVIREYIGNVIHMSLGTSANNKPWVCEVHFAFDENLNIYFRSLTSRRHSQDIAGNAQVAGNIVESHGMQDRPRGVYFEGTAELLSDVSEDSEAYQAVNQRFSLGTKILDESTNEEGHQFYKITVSDFYLFDARESKPSQKYHLEWNR